MQIDSKNGTYLIGCGIYDVTGPAAEVGMMGFAEVAQTTQGIYMRLWSRAFIIADEQRRVVYVTADLCMIYQAVKQAVVEKVKNDAELRDWYDDRNILLSATHTHSGPGGYSHHFLYNVTTKGFIPQNFEAIVEGIYQSIRRAHRNLEPGTIRMARGPVEGYGFNRATRPYSMNPQAERDKYSSDLDKEMTLLRFDALDGRPLGMVNWLGVHPTSIGPANRLIGGDHKGLAAYWFERDQSTDTRKEKTFVGAFALAPAGDVSPNLWGVADGIHDYEHMEIIARKQYDAAVELYRSASEVLSGPVDARHRYVDFSKLHIDALDVDTVPAAMGASFLAGSTEDNESQVKIFHDGATVDSLQGHQKALTSVIDSAFGAVWPKTLSEDYIKGQAPKKILVPTGLATWDGNPWTPQVLPVQVVRIGQLALAAQPTEITTMAGRRVRETVVQALSQAGVTHAVVASHSNAYSSYVTTPEEYTAQEYEGASTHFGPHTLDGFLQEFKRLGEAIATGSAVAQGLYPKDYKLTQLTLQPGVVYDAAPRGKKFGDVLVDAEANYRKGAKISVEFVGAHPRNDLLTMSDFAVVEKKSAGGFSHVLGDRDPQLTFCWQRTRGAESKVIITWDTKEAEAGEYCIRYRGVAKSFWFGRKTKFEGVSGVFTLS
ncbi:MAG TPA: neutral/alkaline ceramidase [Turneriella sp.]|nr:neutral/alkaline ceramidase [Turneriella sp.]